MADGDWKKRVGVEINYSSGSEEGEEEEDKSTESGSGRVDTDVDATAKSIDEEHFNAILDEDEALGYYKYGSTPPRTRILERLKSFRKREERASRSPVKVTSARGRAGNKQVTMSADLADNFEEEEEDGERESSTKKDLRKRKRSLNLLRESERDMKRDSADFSALSLHLIGEEESELDSSSGPPEDRSESVPLLRQYMKTVETCKRFLCLTSKLVTNKDDAVDGPPKQAAGCPQNRVDFYKAFSKVIKLGNTENKSSYGRQKSHQEQMWQNEVKDLLWLELKSYHADLPVTEQDTLLCIARGNVRQVLTEIMAYKFEAGGNDATTGGSSGKEEEKGDSAIGSDLEDGSTGGSSRHNPFVFDVKKPGEVHENCLDVFCLDCTHRQNQALLQVEDLLCRLDQSEQLYPSTKALAEEHELYCCPELTSRVSILCTWYNITTQLRLHIDILGKLLTPLLGCTNVPWPCWQDFCTRVLGEDEDSTSGDESTKMTSPDILKSNRLEPPLRRNSGKHHVQFSMSDVGSPDGAFSNNASDSNNSSDSGNPGGGAGSQAHTPTHTNPPTPTSFGPMYGVSPYRKYVEKLLKTKGLRKMLQMLDRLFMPILIKTRKVLVKKVESASSQDSTNCCGDQWNSMRAYSNCHLTSTHCAYKAMGLPSFRGLYLFLCRIPLDVIHECLKIRLEQKPERPSPLSIRQLMRECKEALKAAVVERRNYMHMIRVAIWDVPPHKLEEYKGEVQLFDDNVKAMLQAYLEYLQQWINMFQQDDSVIYSYQKNLLEEEWAFVKATCPHIPGGEVMAGDSFCRMACSMLGAIGDHLGKAIEELVSTLLQEVAEDDDDDHSFKHVMLQICRESQSVFHDSRERAMKAIAFAKTLRKDLEIGAEFSFQDSYSAILRHLKETDHACVSAPGCSSALLLVPLVVRQRPGYICHLLDLHYGCDSSALPHPQGGESDEEGYLIIMKNADGDTWEGETVAIRPTNETSSSLSRLEVEELLLVVCDPSQLALQRRQFQKAMGDCLRLKKEQCASSPAIEASLEALKNGSLTLCDQISQSIQEIEIKCDLREVEDLDEIERTALLARLRDTLHQCYKFGFEYHKEVGKLVTGEVRRKQAAGLLSFARQWMTFAVERCERGRGLRPRWANQGLDFLITVCDPHNTMYLDDDGFEELQGGIDKCISHVIGSADKTPSPRSLGSAGSGGGSHSRGSSPSPLSRRPYRPSRSMQDVGSLRESLAASREQLAEPAASPVVRRRGHSQSWAGRSDDPTHNSTLAESLQVPSLQVNQCVLPHMLQVQNAVAQLEHQREQQLREEGVIGEVVHVQTVDRYYYRAKSVTFSWQRGIKVGQGRFGKVYAAVNNQTGELMAMKEIQLQPSDVSHTIRTVYEELRIFEGIHHRHLVRHYGAELHRDEMLIFMEYCAEGTLEAAVAATEDGLPEALVRRYTHQLVMAVCCLHDHGVVHRDIKSANIFLSDDGNCLKLGDFGCAAKIRAHTTMPGELRGFVGTQAYMAPEVFTKNMSEGHGRAADVWSVGCVVIEMASGKRPWADLESNYQIMFKVGTGECPPVPESLSEEGQDFVERCLQHDPRQRATAAELLGHHFVKVDQEEEGLVSLPFLSQLDSLPQNYLQTFKM